MRIAYQTVVTEKYLGASGFWNKILELDPADVDAKNGMDYIKSKTGGK